MARVGQRVFIRELEQFAKVATIDDNGQVLNIELQTKHGPVLEKAEKWTVIAVHTLQFILWIIRNFI